LGNETDASVAIGSIVDDYAGITFHHLVFTWSSGQFDFCLGHRRLHLRRYWDATFRTGLHAREFLSGSRSAMEFQRFLPLFYDDLSNSVWRMGRAALGLYASREKICKNKTKQKKTITFFHLSQFKILSCLCRHVQGSEICFSIFLPALVMGNFLVLNLFLALLLNSFSCEELKSRKEVSLYLISPFD
jgi:hypothetical protein